MNLNLLYFTFKVNRNDDKDENRKHILPVNLFQSCTDDFNGEEFEKFVADIKWRIKYKIPANINDLSFRDIKVRYDILCSPDYCREQELVVILKRGEDRLTEEEVGEDAPSEDDEHGGHPEGQRVLPGEGKRPWNVTKCTNNLEC